MTVMLRRFVECESPSDDAAAVNRFVDLVSETVAPFAKVKTFRGGKFGRMMVAEMQLPGRRKSGQVLALGHSDTVWPMGTLRGIMSRTSSPQTSTDCEGAQPVSLCSRVLLKD